MLKYPQKSSLFSFVYQGRRFLERLLPASKADVKEIKDSLNMKNPMEVIGDPNRANIFYETVFRKGDDVDFFQELPRPMASELKEIKLNNPLTVLYLPLKWCGFAFKFFAKHLGKEQYYPLGAEASTFQLFFICHSSITLVPEAFFYSLLANLATRTASFIYFWLAWSAVSRRKESLWSRPLGTSLSCHQLLTVVSDWRIFLIALRVIWLDGLNIFGDGSGVSMVAYHLHGVTGW